MKLLSQQYFRWIFAAFLIALAFSKGLSSVLEVSLVVLSVFFNYKQINRQNLKQNYLVLFPALILGAYLLGMLYSTNQTAGWKMINSQHSLLLLPVIVFLNAASLKQHLNFFLKVFVFGVAIAGIITAGFNTFQHDELLALTNKYSFLQPFEGNEDMSMYFGMYAPFNNKIQFSNLLGLGAIVNMYLLLSVNRKWYLALTLLVIVSMSVALGGRGAQLALLFGVFVFAMYWLYKKALPVLLKKLSKPVATVLLLAIIVLGGIATPFLTYKYVSPIHNRYGQLFWELEMLKTGEYKQHDFYHFTSLRRILSWQHTWTLIQQNPILGTGTGDYKDELQKIYDADDFGDIPLNNHNQYLHIWAALGIWGLAVFVGVILFWFFKLRQFNLFYAFCIAVMGFYLLAMIPDAILLRQSDNMLFSLFYSWLATVGLAYQSKI